MKRFERSEGILHIDVIIGRKEDLKETLLSVSELEPRLNNHLQGDVDTCCLLKQRCDGITPKPLGTKGKVGIPYLIVDNQNRRYVTKMSKYDNKVVYAQNPPITVDAPESECISPEFRHMRYMGLDEFTNEFCVSIIVEEAFKRWDMRGKYFGVRYEGATVCDGTGIHITDYAELGDLKSLSKNELYTEIYNVGFTTMRLVQPEVIANILPQVVTAIHYLDETIQFRSNDLKVENIFVEPGLVTGSYGTLKFTGDEIQPLRCKIADYGKSSCTYTTNSGERIRVYNWSTLARQYLRVSDFTPDIRTVDGRSYYVVDNTFVAQTYALERHMGVPYYRSFDYYTFILSLVSIPAYHYMFFSGMMDEARKRFWDQIWIDNRDKEKIMRRIEKAMRSGKRVSHTKTIKMLKGIKLYCDVVDHIVYY